MFEWVELMGFVFIKVSLCRLAGVYEAVREAYEYTGLQLAV